VVGVFRGGQLTRDEVQASALKLPPLLQQEYRTQPGRLELAQSLVDKKLLVQEAERRGLDRDPSVEKEVTELRERLELRKLFELEQKAAPAVGEEEARQFFETHQGDFSEPERIHVARILAATPARATPADKQRAEKRAASFAQRLRAGEALAKVAKDGDGPEKSQAGDLGLLARGDPAFEEAAFALPKPGAISAPTATAGGVAVFQLLDRRPGRTPAFDEVRAQVLAKLEPARQRRIFDHLVTRLRQQGDVHFDPVALK
jgi:parvulin-like peptidyl-prolyl isomerase